MIDVVGLTQTTLDNSLQKIPLHCYWLRRQDIDDDQNPDEYVVYTVDEHEPEDGADGRILIYRSYVTIRYFCRDSWPGDAGQAAVIRSRLATIRAAMSTGGFDCSGWQNVGDVDGISFDTFVMTAEYAEVDCGNDQPE